MKTVLTIGTSGYLAFRGFNFRFKKPTEPVIGGREYFSGRLVASHSPETWDKGLLVASAAVLIGGLSD